MSVWNEALCRQVIQTVQEAGTLFTDPAALQAVRHKSETDYVTNVDLLVQETLKERLRDLAPQVQFMGEEQDNSGLDWSRPCWILDPVDGTTNLIHRFPPGPGGGRAVRVRRGV